MVIVVGGGFAGRLAAVRLRRGGAPVTLVDARPASVERTRLHEAAATGRDVTTPLPAFAGRIGATFVQGAVEAVPEGGVRLADGRFVAADQVIVAAGSVPRRSVPGALTVDDDAAAIHAAARDGAPLVVVGAGLTGLEVATALAGHHPRTPVTLVGRPTGWSPAAEARVEARLAALGVARAPTVPATLPAGAVLIDATGLAAPAWLAASGLPVDGEGRLRVDAALRCEGRPDVVAAGDCASTRLRRACATALPMGAHAADTVLRLRDGRTPRPFTFRYVLRCVALGPGEAVVQGTTADDAPTWCLGGGAGARVKAAILWSVARIAEWEASSGVPLYGWPAGEVAVP